MERKDNDPVVFTAGMLDTNPLPLEEDFEKRLDFSCSRETLNLRLGGVHVRIHVDDQGLRDHIGAKYGVFVTDPSTRPDVMLHVRVMDPIPFETFRSTFCTYRVGDRIVAKFREMAGYVDLSSMEGRAVIGPGHFSQDFENFIRPVLCSILPRFDAVLFHTAAIARNQKTYIFFGPSGAGKSTITKLASDHIVLTDDMIVLRVVGNRVRAQTCGFWGGRTTEYPSLDLDLPVAAFLPLKKDETNRIIALSPAEAVLAFLLNIPSVARTVQEQEGILDLGRAVARNCPFLELHFSKEDDSFWKVIDEATGV